MVIFRDYLESGPTINGKLNATYQKGYLVNKNYSHHIEHVLTGPECLMNGIAASER